MTRDFRIGCGAGFSSDRLDPAVDLAVRGALDVLVFECVGERTLAFGHRDRQADPAGGYNPLLARRMRAILPLVYPDGPRIVTNMGVANPLAAAGRTVEIARELGLAGLEVAALTGDDIGALLPPDKMLWEGRTIEQVGRPCIGANAYLGAEEILAALDTDAHVVITGRVADPSLFVAPLRRHFGWAADAWAALGRATAAGHLLECGAQVTGGYFADPGFKDVEGQADIGFPYAEVGADGGICVTKLPDTGGLVDERTVKEQLLYEVHDPERYRTPDVTADFSNARVAAAGADRVAVRDISGSPRPAKLKATVAFDGGWLAEAAISYAGDGAQARAALAGEIVSERMRTVHASRSDLRTDLIGAGSLHATARRYADAARDVRLRCALRTDSREEADLLLWEVESLLCCGPSGGGGYRGAVTASVVTSSASVERDLVVPRVEVLRA